MKNQILIGLAAVCLLLSPFPVSATAQQDLPDLESLGSRAVRAAFLQLKIDGKTGDLACLTNAGWTRYNGRSTRPLYDVLASAAGTTLGKSNLLSVHTSVDTPLWFVFAHKRSSGELIATDVRIDGADVKAIEPVNIRIKKHQSFEPFKKVFGERAFSVVTLLNAWADGTPDEILHAAAFHDHYCVGVASGHFTVEYVRKHLPLGKGQRYTYVGSPGYCQDDFIVNALNLTPGKGNYVTMKYPWYRPWKASGQSYANLSGIVIRYCNKQKAGSASVLQFDWREDDFKRFIGEPELQIEWHEMPWLHVLYNRFFMQHLQEPEYFVSLLKAKELKSERDYQALVRLGANPLAELLGPDPTW